MEFPFYKEIFVVTKGTPVNLIQVKIIFYYHFNYHLTCDRVETNKPTTPLLYADSLTVP